MNRFLFRLPFFFFIVFIFSCEGEKQAQFPAKGANSVLFAKGKAAREGTLDFSNPKKLEYRFDDSFSVPPNSSMEIEYEFSFPLSKKIDSKYRIILDTGEASWELPIDENWPHYFYSVPVGAFLNGHFNIALESSPQAGEKIDKNSSPVFKIKSIQFVERWFGYYAADEVLYSSPFIFYETNSKYDYDLTYLIDVPASFIPDSSFAEIEVVISSGTAILEFAGRRIDALPGTEKIYISSAMFPSVGRESPLYAVLAGDEIESFNITLRPSPDVFPIPIKADPALILEWPKASWRKNDYEVFRWDRFPSLLIFDTADYSAQDRLFKRLAFFVEKAGFRGRLASDSEIADLHGWNAHDYRAVDLARFFDAARVTQFPLLEEERELERILLNEGIIRESGGGIIEGTGGIISISRESEEYLRYMLMAHEGFHGLFFIDEDFRDFCRQRFEQLPVTAKRFITSYFDYMAYDTKDEYLFVNEFMAYVLQQAVSGAGEYWGKTAPSRLENSWRSSALPQKDEASGSWPSLASVFTAEAEALSAYVNQRWGLRAGRIWCLKVN